MYMIVNGFSINSETLDFLQLKEDRTTIMQEWKYIPTRYIYQSFTPMLRRLLNIVQDLS